MAATSDAIFIASKATRMSQGSAGFEPKGGPSASVFGLEPYIGLQGEWDWIKGDDLTLLSGDVFKADDWGITWRAGVQGRITGLAPGTWAGALLEGSDAQFEIVDTGFGRNHDRLSAYWSLAIPLW